MNWTGDKIKHYRRSFNWSRTGLILGVWVVVIFALAGRFDWWVFTFPIVGAILILIAGLAKEIIYDKWMGQGQFEWLDMKANLIGAFEGLWRIKKRFK